MSFKQHVNMLLSIMNKVIKKMIKDAEIIMQNTFLLYNKIISFSLRINIEERERKKSNTLFKIKKV